MYKRLLFDLYLTLFYSSFFAYPKKTLFSLNFIEYKSYSIFLCLFFQDILISFSLCRSVFYWYSDFCSVFFFFCWRIARCIACPGTHWISIDTGLLAASSDSKSSNKAALPLVLLLLCVRCACARPIWTRVNAPRVCACAFECVVIVINRLFIVFKLNNYCDSRIYVCFMYDVCVGLDKFFTWRLNAREKKLHAQNQAAISRLKVVE